MYASNYNLHTGAYFGLIGVVLWMLASLLMPVFFVTGWILYLQRRRIEGRAKTDPALQPAELFWFSCSKLRHRCLVVVDAPVLNQGRPECVPAEA